MPYNNRTFKYRTPETFTEQSMQFRSEGEAYSKWDKFLKGVDEFSSATESQIQGSQDINIASAYNAFLQRQSLAQSQEEGSIFSERFKQDLEELSVQKFQQQQNQAFQESYEMFSEVARQRESMLTQGLEEHSQRGEMAHLLFENIGLYLEQQGVREALGITPEMLDMAYTQEGDMIHLTAIGKELFQRILTLPVGDDVERLQDFISHTPEGRKLLSYLDNVDERNMIYEMIGGVRDGQYNLEISQAASAEMLDTKLYDTSSVSGEELLLLDRGQFRFDEAINRDGQLVLLGPGGSEFFISDRVTATGTDTTGSSRTIGVRGKKHKELNDIVKNTPGGFEDGKIFRHNDKVYMLSRDPFTSNIWAYYELTNVQSKSNTKIAEQYNTQISSSVQGLNAGMFKRMGMQAQNLWNRTFGGRATINVYAPGEEK